MKIKLYTLPLSEIIDRQCFTAEGDPYVYYEDTEKGCARSFHSYLQGNLYNSNVIPPATGNFYYCDIKGNILDKEIVLEIHKLRKEVRELKRNVTILPFDLYECRDTNALVRIIGEPYQTQCTFTKELVVQGVIVHHVLDDDIGNTYEFIMKNLKKLEK